MKLYENHTEAKVLKIRSVRYTDQMEVLDCDLKCFDVPWDSDTWEFVEDNHTIKVATLNGKLVGFSVFYYDRETKLIKVPKIAVKLDFRRMGIGTKLLHTVDKYAKGTPGSQMEMILPENFVNPNDKRRDCSVWLREAGWRAEGISRGLFQDLGRQQDGIRFTRGVV